MGIVPRGVLYSSRMFLFLYVCLDFHCPRGSSDISDVAVLFNSYVRVLVLSSFPMTETKSYSSSLLVTTNRCVDSSSVVYAECVFEVAVLVEGCPRVIVL